MQYKKEDLGKNKVKFAVVVSKDVITKNHSAAIKRLGKDAKISGFRKGHVPMEVLEKAIDPAQLASVELDGAINQTVIELIEAEDLQLLDQPKVEVTKYVPNDTLEISVEIEVVPPVKLADATKLKVKKPEVEIDDEQIDDVIARLRTSAAKKELVDRAAKNGDEVVIDFTGLKEGIEFPGGKAKDYQLELGSGAFIPGFEEGIVGHKAGEDFDINVTFPEEYGAKDLAGKKAVFKISLKKVNELTLPELNDEFAKTIAPDLATMQALRDDVKNELEKQEEASIREDYQNELLDKLAEKSKIEVPQVLVDDQVPQMKAQFTQNLMYRGMDLESYLNQLGKTEEQWEKEDLRTSAEKRIRNSLAMRQLIKDYEINVSDEDIDEYQAKILSRYNNPKMKENFQTAEARTQIRQQLLTERAMQKLVELNEAK
ncbi:MAG: trigger factor [Candidatus Saccharibacteria bacterium]|nr:trigger factor [Candidatus Saccharibacteria bacterium]